MSAITTNISQMLSVFDAAARERVSGLIDEIGGIVERSGIYGEIACCVVSSGLLTDVAKAQAADKG